MPQILGLGWQHYWFSSWNKFDSAIVVLAVAQLGYPFFQPAVFLRVLDIFRIEKLLRVNEMTWALEKWRVIRVSQHDRVYVCVCMCRCRCPCVGVYVCTFVSLRLCVCVYPCLIVLQTCR